MNKSLRKLSLFVLIVLLFLFSCVNSSVAQPSSFQHKRLFDDDSVVRRLKKNGIKYEMNRSVLWIERGYLSEDEIEKLGILIDSGILKVEQYLGLTFDKERYEDDRIHYFIKSGRFVSHVYGRRRQREFTKPIVFLSFTKGKRSPYLHETVHIIAWEFSSLWIREGLAVYLNDKLGGFPAFPNLGRDIDECVKEYLNRGFKGALRLIGENGIPDLSSNRKKISILESVLAGRRI